MRGTQTLGRHELSKNWVPILRQVGAESGGAQLQNVEGGVLPLDSIIKWLN